MFSLEIAHSRAKKFQSRFSTKPRRRTRRKSRPWGGRCRRDLSIDACTPSAFFFCLYALSPLTKKQLGNSPVGVCVLYCMFIPVLRRMYIRHDVLCSPVTAAKRGKTLPARPKHYLVDTTSAAVPCMPCSSCEAAGASKARTTRGGVP